MSSRFDLQRFQDRDFVVKVMIGILGLQCMALAFVISWLLLHRYQVGASDSTRDAISSYMATSQQERTERRGSGRRKAGGRGAGGPAAAVEAMPSYDSEEAALADYLDRLDMHFDMKLVLSGVVKAATIEHASRAAHACSSFDCAALRSYQQILLEAGRSVPPEPPWEGQEQHGERRAVTEYIYILETAVREAAQQEGRPELLLGSDLMVGAMSCESFSCNEMNVLIEAAGISLSALGRSIPAKPDGEGYTNSSKRNGGSLEPNPPPPSVDREKRALQAEPAR